MLKLNSAKPAGFILVLLITVMTGCLTPVVNAAQCGSIGAPHQAGGGLDSADGYMQIRLHGSLALPSMACKSLPLMGMSGLAWAVDTGILYALSDRANLFHLQPEFRDGKLVGVSVVDAFPLRDKNDKPLDNDNGDSEGLTVIHANNGIRGDEILLVSFERRPRISRYRPYGLLLGQELLPAELADIHNYHSANAALESVVVHPEHGVLTAPQLPLKASSDNQFRIYDQTGVIAEFTPADKDYGTLTELALTPAGNLLALERIFSGAFGITAAVIHHLDLQDAAKSASTLVRMDRDEGHAIDNFEGLTHHKGNHYFMVSDDNGFALQQTLLFYFEVLPENK